MAFNVARYSAWGFLKPSEDKKKLLNDIHNIQEICAKGYDTFSEAYKAASVIELGSLNEYDLK